MDIRKLRIIDVDAHITEPPDLWTRRAPARFAQRVPRVVDVDGVPNWSFDGVLLGRVNLSSVIRPTGEKIPGPAFFTFEREEIHPASFDMRARLDVLDAQGIWAQVLYPNVGGFGAQGFAKVLDPELRQLCVTLYNDAMLEIQEESGGRLLPMALMPWWDPVASTEEVRRTAAAGLRGVNICTDPQVRGAPELWQPEWEPFWEACAEQRQSVNFHIGASESSMNWYGSSPWPGLDGERKLAIGSAMMYLSNARVLANLIFSGVLERFPAVKFVSVESGIGWIPFFLESLDYQIYESAPSVVRALSMLPSEYFKRQVYGCFWFERRQVKPVVEALGASQIMFETDYPHPTCLYPDPLASVEKALEGIDARVVRRLLQDNAAELYRVKLPDLRRPPLRS
jgi:predicted TIM-barrel fold metal-dependent hydrolase